MKIKIVKNPEEASEYLKKLICDLVDSETALFLSGGKTPRETYLSLAREKKIHPAAAALIDERYGRPMHANSNEKLLGDCGLLGYFKGKSIPFYHVLQKNVDLEEASSRYRHNLKVVFSNYPKRIGILGVGVDGHIAGLPAGIQNSILRQAQDKNQKYVEVVRDFPGEIKERVTMTFFGLSMLSHLIVMVLGENKKEALRLMFQEGSIEEIPARFFTKPEISGKTILITDQKI